MAISDIKLALLFTIVATVSISSTKGLLLEEEGQLFTIATRLAEIIPLLENVTDTSVTMQSFLPHLMKLFKNQEDVQILTNVLLRHNTATAHEVASVLPVIEGILQSQQDKQDQVVTLLRNQQENHYNHNHALTLLQNQQDTLNQIANSQLQIVNLLQIQSRHLENMTVGITHLVGQLDQQNDVASKRIIPTTTDTDVHASTDQNPTDVHVPTMPTDNPIDCSDLISRGSYLSGSYTISSLDNLGGFRVYCDMDTDDGGWTVIQRRFDGTVDFYLGWDDYEDGFGSPDGEYWIGLRQIHRLTQQGTWDLRIDLKDFNNNEAYAEYKSFAVGDAESFYVLSIGAYSGTAGDSLTYHNNRAFSTKDSDNDHRRSDNCAQLRNGAWWYTSCANTNLNGLYLEPSQDSNSGMYWYNWKNNEESLKRSEMKIRRMGPN